MKSGVGLPPAKRRWKGLVVAVLGLVLLSMLVPLVFIIRVQTPSGYATEQHPTSASGNKSIHADALIQRFVPTLPKDTRADSIKGTVNKTSEVTKAASVEETENKTDGLAVHADVAKSASLGNNVKENAKGIEGNDKLCELKFGSYCLWRQEHRENMKDAMVKRMKDMLFVARAYYPSIAKLPALDKLSHDMKQNIQDFERVLSETTADKDLPPLTEKKLSKMEAVIARAKSSPVDCNNVDKKFRQLVDLTEDEANFHMKQSAFLYKLAVQTMPKSLHCLSMRLTVEHFRSRSLDDELLLKEKFLNPKLNHYVIFSNNVLASSVVINSTVMAARESKNQVFHVLTDRQNYFAMKSWFFRNKYKEAVVEVLNVEDHKSHDLGNSGLSHLSLPEEFRITIHRVDKPSLSQIRTEYLSVLSHSHYLLPKIFRNLKKLIILDDDILVQRDLSALWDLQMNGKVIAAEQFCSVRLVQLKSYLGDKSFDGNSCAWMSGLIIVDLDRWRQRNFTETYQKLVQEQLRTEDGLSEAKTLRASLLTFEGFVYGLDDSWQLSGMGHNYDLSIEAIKRAAVLHYNGNMKPWLELGIPKYRSFWRKFLNQEDQFLSDCNVN